MTASIPLIVGIGASVSGWKLLNSFRVCPAGSSMAFVLVHESLLMEILQRVTTMPVTQALDQIAGGAQSCLRHPAYISGTQII